MLGLKRVTYPVAVEPGANVLASPGPLTFCALGQVLVMPTRLVFWPG